MDTNQNEIFNRQLSKRLSVNDWPAIDVTDRVMGAIRAGAGTAQRSKKLSRTSLIAGMAALVVVLSGFGYSALKWQLHRADGSVSLEYREFDSTDNGTPSESEAVDRLRSELAPGEAAAYMSPQKGIEYVAFENPIEYDTFAEVAPLIELPAAFPSELPDGFAFYKGAIHHDLEMISPAEIEEWRQEMERSGQSEMMKPLATTGFSAVSLLYHESNGEEIRINATFGEMWRTVYTDLSKQSMDKVEVNGIEAFAITDSDSGKREIAWIDDSGDVPLYFQVSSVTSAVEWDQLIDAAESIRVNELR